MFRNSILALVFLVFVAVPALAAPITVDEILFASGTDASLLSGLVDMELTGNELTITLTNISANAASSGAGILLTGIGFQLPSGVAISSGSADMTGSVAVNFLAPLDGNVSQEWGFDNDPLNSGAFLGVASLSYNTVVGAMESLTTNQFAPGSIAQPPNLDGPDFGLVSSTETGALGDGVEAIRSRIYISLLLSGTVPIDLVSQIEAGNVGLTFGSPDSTTHSVPEPGSLSLLVVGLASLGAAMRRKKRSSQSISK